jgi:hypothetical protein
VQAWNSSPEAELYSMMQWATPRLSAMQVASRASGSAGRGCGAGSDGAL